MLLLSYLSTRCAQEQLDILLSLAKSPKLKFTPRIGSVVSTLKKLFKDSNVVVVGLCVKGAALMLDVAKCCFLTPVFCVVGL